MCMPLLFFSVFPMCCEFCKRFCFIYFSMALNLLFRDCHMYTCTSGNLTAIGCNIREHLTSFFEEGQTGSSRKSCSRLICSKIDILNLILVYTQFE